MIGKLDEALRFHEAALSVRGQRQQILASNIANADTPQYKARDIDFGKALEGAMGRTRVAATMPAGLVKTSAAHMGLPRSSSGTIAPAESGPLLYRTNPQSSVDSNTVDLDVERNQFADNAIRYEASLTMVSGQIKNLLAAIQG